MALTQIKTGGLANNSVTDAKVADAITVTGAQTGITQVGTLTAGTWNGTAIASAYLDADTAHLSGSTFTGNLIVDKSISAGDLNTAPIVTFKNSYGSGHYTAIKFEGADGSGANTGFLGYMGHNTSSTRRFVFSHDGTTRDVAFNGDGTTTFNKTISIGASNGSEEVKANRTRVRHIDGLADASDYSHGDLYINHISSGNIICSSNVGIGTTSPNANSSLHIVQDVSGSGYYGLAVQGDSSTGGARIGIGESDSNFSTRANVIDFGFDGTTDFIYSRTGKDFIFGVNSAERMRITSNGTVQINNGVAYSMSNNAGNGTLNGLWAGGSDELYVGNDNGWDSIRFLPGSAEKMRITSAGTVGIGDSNPAVDFVVKGSDPHIRIWDSSPSEWWNISVGQGADGRIEIDDTDNDNGVYMNQNATSWSSGSDERLKTNWTAFEDALSSINSLTKVGTFQYTKSIEDQTPKNDAVHSGLSAQEVQKFLPSSVSEDNDGILGLQYQHLIPVLVKAVQELSAKVETLENE